MFSLYFTALKSLAVKETNRYLRIWVQTLVPPVITTSLCQPLQARTPMFHLPFSHKNSRKISKKFSWRQFQLM